jgi:two-component system NtrC family response regulator
MARILIADDDVAVRTALGESIADLGHQAAFAGDGREALVALNGQDIDAAFLDLRMPEMDGLEVLRQLQHGEGTPPIAVLTAHASSANTIEAMRLGAFDHLQKPISKVAIGTVLSGMLKQGKRRARRGGSPREGGLVGSSEAIRAVQKQIGLLVDSDATVLILGETGTGKELVARAIHDHGNRKDEPFIAVNCAAIPKDLLESELFGHMRGSFTGAASDRLGAFREAQHGTLFLDEIGDMDLSMQAKILRALQEKSVTPLGGKPVRIEVRIVAATHRQLSARISEGLFREDLYYRLAVVPITLPPLRERAEDIVTLAEFFLSNKTLSQDAKSMLLAYQWPGNVRELKNVMERASLTTSSVEITAADLNALQPTQTSENLLHQWPFEDLPRSVELMERMLIEKALKKHSNNRADAARALGINRQMLYTKIKRYGLDLSGFETDGVRESDGASPHS